jgi:hypothetical protein
MRPLVVRISVNHAGEVDPDRVVDEFPKEWEEFLDGDEPTDALKREFVSDTAAEIGMDILDLAPYYDTDVETEVSTT